MALKSERLNKVSEFRLKLYVENFDAERQFYENILKFPVRSDWNRGPHDRGVMFDTGAAILEILTSKKQAVPIQGADISLEVTDVWRLFEKLHGQVKVVFDLRDNDWGDTSFCISDPAGFHITFFTRHNV